MRPFLLSAAAVTAPRVPLRLLGRGLAAAMSTAGPLKSVDYEVFGRVQGVCFRMYTEDEAKKIGVVGWVKNTSKGTVTGQVQGPEKKVNSIDQRTQDNIQTTSTPVRTQCLVKGEVLAERGWKS
ncbi:acylphosphatase-2 isoform X4 [Manis javanica]|uniref:acylphosphatase-2 isoform X4 n=1 Tax=Manis javanica TaxID=9974 RepID=UPI003C6D92C1